MYIININNCFAWLLQIENSASLSPLDGDQMTPIGRAMERGAKRSAQYLLQIGTFNLYTHETFQIT